MSEAAMPETAVSCPAAVAPGRAASPLADTVTMTARALRLARRTPDAMITALMLPVMLMLLFVYLFGGAIQTGTAYVTYVAPGVLVLCAGFGSTMVATTVCQDMAGGIVDRFRSMDVRGSAVLGGHVISSLVRNIVSTALVLGLAIAIGFRPHAGAAGWLAAVGILLAWVLALSWLSAAVGLLVRSPEATQGFGFFVSFLPYPSSAFVPVHTMPSWIHGFADNQPITPVIESIRGLLLGTPVGSHPWVALARSGGILAASVALAGAMFSRRTA